MDFYQLNHLKAMGVSHVIDMMAMVTLRDCSQLNCSSIAKAIGCSTATVTNLVERLLKADVVERFQHPSSRRELLVKLSPHGHHLCEIITNQNQGEQP